MGETILALVDDSDEVALALKLRLHRNAVSIRCRDEARDRSPRKIDCPVQWIEALYICLDDRRIGLGEPVSHRRSTSAERIARATCRLDRRSACGSDGAGVWIAIATRTSRDEPFEKCSILPLLDGTNSSGPLSPTRYPRPELTGPPVARPGAPVTRLVI